MKLCLPLFNFVLTKTALHTYLSFNDHHNPIIFQYILETAERGTQRIYHTRLTIFQRLSNDEYLGKLLRH